MFSFEFWVLSLSFEFEFWVLSFWFWVLMLSFWFEEFAKDFQTLCALPSLKGLIQTPLQNIDRHTLNYVFLCSLDFNQTYCAEHLRLYPYMEDCLRPLPISPEVVHVPGMIFKVFSVRYFGTFWRKPKHPVRAVLEVGDPLGHHARADCVLNPAVSVHKFLRNQIITVPVHA